MKETKWSLVNTYGPDMMRKLWDVIKIFNQVDEGYMYIL